jgi:hypothetical protein
MKNYPKAVQTAYFKSSGLCVVRNKLEELLNWMNKETANGGQNCEKYDLAG